ncbi:phage BR0599 family protein, partial [Salmonella enterica]|nr:phage BR0599 family protein [Salmonella enterica]
GLREQDSNTLHLFGGTTGLQVGQPVKLYPGCDRTIATCDNKFANHLNYGGQPHMPGKSPYTIIKLF